MNCDKMTSSFDHFRSKGAKALLIGHLIIAIIFNINYSTKGPNSLLLGIQDNKKLKKFKNITFNKILTSKGEGTR